MEKPVNFQNLRITINIISKKFTKILTENQVKQFGAKLLTTMRPTTKSGKCSCSTTYALVDFVSCVGILIGQIRQSLLLVLHQRVIGTQNIAKKILAGLCPQKPNE